MILLEMAWRCGVSGIGLFTYSQRCPKTYPSIIILIMTKKSVVCIFRYEQKISRVGEVDLSKIHTVLISAFGYEDEVLRLFNEKKLFQNGIQIMFMDPHLREVSSIEIIFIELIRTHKWIHVMNGFRYHFTIVRSFRGYGGYDLLIWSCHNLNDYGASAIQ